MNANHSRLARLRRFTTAGIMGTCLLWWPGGCDLGTFSATSTVTLDGREVISSIVKSGILTPLETWIDAGVEALFDRLEDDD